MRKGSFRGLVTAAVFSASALLLACPMGPLHVMIPDFATAEVQGIQVYRVADRGGQLQDAGKIEFGEITKNKRGVDTLEYTLLSSDGNTTYGPLYTEVIRDESNSAAIDVTLAFYNELPAGWFKVASYNAAGTSKASANQAYFVDEQS